MLETLAFRRKGQDRLNGPQGALRARPFLRIPKEKMGESGVLELRDVAKLVEGEAHIAPTSLTLAPGTLNVLLGPSLSGKTSLLRLMAGLDRPTSGTVWFNGKDVTGVDVRKRDVAMVYQQFINYPALTVFENIASPLRLAKTPKNEIDRKVRAAAELLRLTPYLDRTPLTLSGGQQQRTALAARWSRARVWCCSMSR